MGPTLACPSVVGEYTAFLRIHKYITRSPMNIPMTTEREELMTTLITTVTPVEKGAAVGAVWRINTLQCTVVMYNEKIHQGMNSTIHYINQR